MGVSSLQDAPSHFMLPFTMYRLLFATPTAERMRLSPRVVLTV